MLLLLLPFLYSFNNIIIIDCEDNSKNPWENIESNSEVFLKRGCVWSTPLILNNLNNVTISPYGEGILLPKIDCSEEIKGWIKQEDLFYTGFTNRHLMNKEISHTRYFYLEKTQEEPFKFYWSNNKKEEEDWVNATFIIRNSMFTFLSAKVLSYTSKKEIVVDTEYLRYFPVKKGAVFILTNKNWMINEKTYSYDEEEIKIKNPSRGLRVITRKSFGVEINRCNNITIREIEVHGCGISVYRSVNLLIKNSKIKNAPDIGIYLVCTENCEVNSCIVENSGKIGIKMIQTGKLINNTIQNTFMSELKTFWKGLLFMGHGIYIDCIFECIVSENMIFNTKPNNET
jgi:parallel beta-helix repeat protein